MRSGLRDTGSRMGADTQRLADQLRQLQDVQVVCNQRPDLQSLLKPNGALDLSVKDELRSEFNRVQVALLNKQPPTSTSRRAALNRTLADLAQSAQVTSSAVSTSSSSSSSSSDSSSSSVLPSILQPMSADLEVRAQVAPALSVRSESISYSIQVGRCCQAE